MHSNGFPYIPMVSRSYSKKVAPGATFRNEFGATWRHFLTRLEIGTNADYRRVIIGET